MKKISAKRILNEVFDSLKEYDQITENQCQFIKRILDDCLYNTDRKIHRETINYFFDTSPEIFNEVSKKDGNTN